MPVETVPVLFSGSIPFNYETYLGPLFFAPYAKDLVQRVRRLQPASVLELACGSGQVSIYWPHIFSRNAKIVASDISEDMVNYAKKKIGNGDRITWKVIDAMDIPFNEATFDCIAVQFGVMFYADRPKAFAEAFRVLKPGGTLFMSTWDELQYNRVAQLADEAIDKILGYGAPPLFKIPFSYNSDEAIRNELRSAGFSNIEIEVIKQEGHSRSASDAVTGLIEGTPAGAEILARNAELLLPIKQELERSLAENFGPSDLKVPLQAKLIKANR